MYKPMLLLALLSISLSSCFKERIELDNNKEENKKIVITGWITSLDEPQFINVSRTVNYLGGLEADQVSGATVTLTDAEITYDLEEKASGVYYLPDGWIARVGNEYKLNVSYEGKTYTATHQMRPCPDIAEAYYDISEEMEESDSIDFYDAVFGFQELAGEGDAYYAVAYPKGTLYGDSLIYGAFADDAFLDGEYFGDLYLPSPEGFFLGDTAVIDFYSIGLETANYLQDIEAEIYRGSPFDAPPANVRTNIVGGAIGYFMISDARRVEVVIE